jgi:hypothetical protein
LPSLFVSVLKANIATQVAFSAVMARHDQHLAAFQTVIFDHVFTSVGGGYDPSSGLFTCPVAGRYNFFFSIMCDFGSEIHTGIVVNGIVKLYTFSHGSDQRLDQGSNAVILDLSVGDRVWIQVDKEAGTRTVYGNNFSSFSGYMTHANL